MFQIKEWSNQQQSVSYWNWLGLDIWLDKTYWEYMPKNIIVFRGFGKVFLRKKSSCKKKKLRPENWNFCEN